MDKLKIRIIDSLKPRNDDISILLGKYNEFAVGGALRESCCDESNDRPDIFLLHVNDLKKNGNPNYDCLIEIDEKLKEALIVLYSGGGIELVGVSDRQIEFRYKGEPWGFDVHDGNRFCIIERPISRGSDFKIVQALERYFISGKDKNIFFEALRHPSIEYLSALLILCQGYLGASIADGEITDEDTMKLIDWDSEIPVRFPALATQAKEVKKASWWSALGEPQEFEEKIKLEFIALDEDEKLKQFLQLVLEKRGIEDYKIVKYCYKKIKEELGGKK